MRQLKMAGCFLALSVFMNGQLLGQDGFIRPNLDPGASAEEPGIGPVPPDVGIPAAPPKSGEVRSVVPPAAATGPLPTQIDATITRIEESLRMRMGYIPPEALIAIARGGTPATPAVTAPQTPGKIDDSTTVGKVSKVVSDILGILDKVAPLVKLFSPGLLQAAPAGQPQLESANIDAAEERLNEIDIAVKFYPQVKVALKTALADTRKLEEQKKRDAEQVGGVAPDCKDAISETKEVEDAEYELEAARIELQLQLKLVEIQQQMEAERKAFQPTP